MGKKEERMTILKASAPGHNQAYKSLLWHRSAFSGINQPSPVSTCLRIQSSTEIRTGRWHNHTSLQVKILWCHFHLIGRHKGIFISKPASWDLQFLSSDVTYAPPNHFPISTPKSHDAITSLKHVPMVWFMYSVFNCMPGKPPPGYSDLWCCFHGMMSLEHELTPSDCWFTGRGVLTMHHETIFMSKQLFVGNMLPTCHYNRFHQYAETVKCHWHFSGDVS